MIFTTIQNKTAEQILEALEQCEMAEIRLDSCVLSAREMEDVFTSDVPLVATCRIAEVMKNEPSLQDLPEAAREVKAMMLAEKRLVRAIEAGARYVDVEIEAPKQMSKRVRSAAHENGTIFIRSYHDFEGTGSLESLKNVVEKCTYHGADLVKVVTMAHSGEDVRKVMSLYGHSAANGNLIAFCMGEAGRQSRLDCLKHGAPYTYSALTEEESAAPGQWPVAQMRKAVYGDFRFIGTGGMSDNGCAQSLMPVKMPVSKSFAQRAIIAAALAEGVSHLKGYSPCGDNEAALQVARNLGAEVSVEGSDVTIRGIAAQRGTLTALNGVDGRSSVDEEGRPTLHVGESGLLTRIMIPVLSQLCPGSVKITGEKTLLNRPLTGAKEIMEAFDAEISFAGAQATSSMTPLASLGRNDNPVSVPLIVTGPLKATRAEISGKHGSQLISGLLMGLPFSEKNSQLIVTDPKSIPYMFITLEVLKKFGIKIANDMLGGQDFLESGGDWSLCTEMHFKVKGGQKYRAADIDLEGDWSAAANFLVAGAIFGKVEIEGLDTTSLQADLSIMDILMDAGASLSQMDGKKGNITVQRAPLQAFEVDASNCPDLFPILAVLAAFCQGTSRMAGVSRLANKESDRAKAILEMLTQMGVQACIEGDELVVEGHSLAERLLGGSPIRSVMTGDQSVMTGDQSVVTGDQSVVTGDQSVVTGDQSGVPCEAPGLLKGGAYTSHHDHRMVMALKVASLGADSPITIDDEACVAKSFPQFNDLFVNCMR